MQIGQSLVQIRGASHAVARQNKTWKLRLLDLLDCHGGDGKTPMTHEVNDHQSICKIDRVSGVASVVQNFERILHVHCMCLQNNFSFFI